MNDTLSQPIHVLQDLLRKREISATELVTHSLSKIEAAADLNSFLEVWSDSALEEAAQADRSLQNDNAPPLCGIPIGMKDVIVTRQGKTTCGSRILENYRSPFDATVVAKLKHAGAIIVGKTNMDEFAMGGSNENSAFGPVLNPWDITRVPGGSSGGSAAAVAARLVPGALGTDTGGSIRQPAAFCNITGLKPTYGRVSRYGLVAFASSLDQAGPMAQDAQDCALLSEIISGRDVLDSTSSDRDVPTWSRQLSAPLKGLRIGIPREYFIKGLQTEVEEKVRAAIKTLEQVGARVVEVSLPHTEAAVATYYIINPAEASSNLARYDGVRYGHRAQEFSDLRSMYAHTRSEGFGREVKRRILVGTYVLSSGYYEAYYLRAQKVRTLLTRDFESVFQNDCDVIACPTTPTTAFRIGEKINNPIEMYLSDVFTVPVNLAGLPGLSMPCGFDRQGLPIGMQLIGKAWDEQCLLQVAHAYQQMTDWHTQVPKG